MNSPNDISFAVETVTPVDAAALLDSNIENNRNISETKVREYVSALENGEWVVNGEAIKISSAGHLVDGQHRLIAVLRSGVPMTTAVVYGVDEPTIVTMDTGKQRTLENVLAMRKVPNRNKVSTVLRTLVRLRSVGRGSALTRGCNRGSATTTACLRLLDAEPDHIYELTKTADRIYGSTHMSIIPSVVVVEELRAVDREVADGFIGSLCTGKVNYDHPVAALRKKLNSDYEQRGKGWAPNYLAQVAWTYKTWNAVLEGRTICRLTYAPVKERFPEPMSPLF